MGHHALDGRKHLPISLNNGWGAMAQWGEWVEEIGMWVDWETKVSQGIHRQRKRMQKRCVFESDPPPSFYILFGDF